MADENSMQPRTILERALSYACRSATVAAASALLLTFTIGATPGHSVTIELKGAGTDRVERQKKAATGQLPLPGTPDIANRQTRLDNKGLRLGSPVFIRIFKEESEVELWMRRGDTFIHFATYPVCNWSGTLGPKMKEGDKQAPEGFYTITRRQLHRTGRWPRSLNLGFPNAFDKSLSRTGSYILVHGGCTSTGCFAMTDPVITEIYDIAYAALKAGQRHIPVHVLPFRLTDNNLARHADSEWFDFWSNLKTGYDSFERTRLPPQINVCQGHYVVRDAPSHAPRTSIAQAQSTRSGRSSKDNRQLAHAIQNRCQPPLPGENHARSQRESLIETEPPQSDLDDSAAAVAPSQQPHG